MDNSPDNPFMLIARGDQEAAGTRMESVEEIRAALQARRQPTEHEVAVGSDELEFRQGDRVVVCCRI